MQFHWLAKFSNRSIAKSDVKLRRVLQETDHHRLERVEWTVPVRIQEAIFQFPDAGIVSFTVVAV